jgi:hypothetical protein
VSIDWIWWIGLFHLVVYGVAGFAAVGEFVINRTVKSLGIQRDLIRMYARYLKEKRDNEDGRSFDIGTPRQPDPIQHTRNLGEL